MLLNPLLYVTLIELFGEVKVVKPGDKGVPPSEYRNPVNGRVFYRWLDGADKGEEYRVNCPFCKDTHFHLYINHRYGEEGDWGGRYKLAQCFKGCLDKPSNRDKLWNLVSLGFRKGVSKETLKKLQSAQINVSKEVDTSLPKNFVSLNTLPPTHKAVAYLLSRGFDWETFRQFNVGYCAVSTNFMASDRIIIPWRFHGDLVGWQSRMVGDNGRGAKYYNLSGVSKSSYLYNFDTAVKQPFLVITEGVTDVWRVGSPAVCIFGKCLSNGQKELICENFAAKPVLVMLDRDAADENRKTCEELRKCYSGCVEIVEYPDTYKDPGTTPVQVIRESIEATLGKINGSI